MGRGRDAEYVQALDELERVRAAGQISSNQYELHRTKLLAEASRRVRNPGRLTVSIIVGVIAALFFIRVLFVLATG